MFALKVARTPPDEKTANFPFIRETCAPPPLAPPLLSESFFTPIVLIPALFICINVYIYICTLARTML